jgi:methylmalonyl-CoA mutase N-terminal domain/subunit
MDHIFATATAFNARYKQLLANGTTGLSVAFDLPTQRGHDSDAPSASGEVGRAGVAIDSLDDMRVLFAGIPLDKASTSMTVNAPAALLLLLYQLVAEEQGVPADRLTGTIRNDVLEEYIARGTSIFPPRPALRLIADTFKYGRAEIPNWNTISISGHHMAEADASPVQEIAFTLANGIEYARTAVAAGVDVDDFAPSFSSKHRAAHRIWARAMKEGFGAQQVDPPLALLAETHSVEKMADDMEADALELMERIEELGGAVNAIEQGFQRSEIERLACADAVRPDESEPYEPLRDPAVEAQQAERLAKLRAWRCGERVADTLLLVQKAAAGADNVLYPMKEALAAGATVGEVCDALREVWGTYVPMDAS